MSNETNMNEATREMTLLEFVNTLPHSHPAQRQFRDVRAYLEAPWWKRLRRLRLDFEWTP